MTAPEGPAAVGAVEQTRSETGLTSRVPELHGEVRDTDRPAKGQEDGVGWHCREDEAAVAIQRAFLGDNI